MIPEDLTKKIWNSMESVQYQNQLILLKKKKLPHLNKDSNQRNFNSHYFYLLKFPLCYLKTSHLAGILSLIIPSA